MSLKHTYIYFNHTSHLVREKFWVVEWSCLKTIENTTLTWNMNMQKMLKRQWGVTTQVNVGGQGHGTTQELFHRTGPLSRPRLRLEIADNRVGAVILRWKEIYRPLGYKSTVEVSKVAQWTPTVLKSVFQNKVTRSNPLSPSFLLMGSPQIVLHLLLLYFVSN